MTQPKALASSTPSNGSKQYVIDKIRVYDGKIDQTKDRVLFSCNIGFPVQPGFPSYYDGYYGPDLGSCVCKPDPEGRPQIIVNDKCQPIERGSCPVSSPVEPALGIKLFNEADYSGAGAAPLGFTRTYRNIWSGTPGKPSFSKYWNHSFSQRISEYGAGGYRQATRRNSDGQEAYFDLPSGGQSWAAYADTRDTLTELKDAGGTRTGWTYKVFADDSVETYNAAGILQSIKARNGWVTTLTYSDSSTPVANYLSGSTVAQPGLLISVKNHFGRELKFIYDAAGRMVQLLPPGAVKDGAVNTASAPIRYGYDAAGNLATVTWQDGTARRYHYEDTRFASHLTGVTDEAGVRIRTYAYDAQGRAISSEQAGGAERYTFSYSGTTGSQTYVTAPDGSTRTYTFQNTGGVIRPTSVSAPCPLCGSTQQSTVYGEGSAANGGAGASGQPIKTVAHDGTVSFTTYDAKGRETEKATFPASFAASATKPALASATAVISTQWHATHNLPTKRAEPNRITAYTYATANASTGLGAGNLTGQSETQTTDATGAAKFAAVQAAGTPVKSTGWSYSSTSSLPVTVVERETPFGSTTAVEKGRWIYTYGSLGSVKTITDKTLAVGTINSFDSAGRVLSGIDSNGFAVQLTYDVRGRVKSYKRDTAQLNVQYLTDSGIDQIELVGIGTFKYVYNASKQLVSVQSTFVNASAFNQARFLAYARKLADEIAAVVLPHVRAQIVLPPLPPYLPLPPRAPVPNSPEAILFPSENSSSSPSLSDISRRLNESIQSIVDKLICDPECKPIQARIQVLTDELRKRALDMYMDKQNLFCTKPKGRGSWQGHIQQYNDKQKELNTRITQAKQKNCPYNPEADVWATRPPPTCPDLP
jgi:YD repeat-containing protein